MTSPTVGRGSRLLEEELVGRSVVEAGNIGVDSWGLRVHVLWLADVAGWNRVLRRFVEGDMVLAGMESAGNTIPGIDVGIAVGIDDGIGATTGMLPEIAEGMCLLEALWDRIC